MDRNGLKVVNITHPASPVLVENAQLPLEDARNIYLARTYAYVAAGRQGVAIVNVEQPEKPVLDQVFNASGKLNDTNDVKLGMVSSSLFAFVADGKNGLQVVQLFSPQATPQFGGFSPRPVPKLIASYRTSGPALAVSRGIDRDRAVDETGNQLAVFGRRGSRPLNAKKCRDSTCGTETFTPSLTIHRAHLSMVRRKSLRWLSRSRSNDLSFQWSALWLFSRVWTFSAAPFP